MLDPTRVADGEISARFIIKPDWFKMGKVQTLAFVPPPPTGTSVTRHEGLTEESIWEEGQKVVSQRQLKSVQTFRLLGRADFAASELRKCGTLNAVALDIRPMPLPGNDNHAVIDGWPPEKGAQISLCQKFLACCTFVACSA